MESINIALQVFGLGFVISMFMAILIKIIIKVIRIFTNKKVKVS